MADRQPPGPFLRFYRIFRWVMLAAIVLVIALILRRSPPPLVESDPAAQQRLMGKLEELQQARSAGQPHDLKMPEAELNSWLGTNLALAPAPSLPPAASAPPAAPDTPAAPAAPEAPPAEPSIEEVRSTVRDVKIDLAGDRLRAYVVFDFHGKDLSLLLEGRLRVADGYLRFEPTGGKLGSLPLPQMTLERAVTRLFDAPENREKFRLPAEIRDIRVENSEIVVSYK